MLGNKSPWKSLCGLMASNRIESRFLIIRVVWSLGCWAGLSLVGTFFTLWLVVQFSVATILFFLYSVAVSLVLTIRRNL